MRNTNMSVLPSPTLDGANVLLDVVLDRLAAT
jgi:hypothetical protein